MNLSLMPLPQPKERTKRVAAKSPLGPRPEFYFDYNASNGISRLSLDDWAIEGVSASADQGQSFKVGISRRSRAIGGRNRLGQPRNGNLRG